MIIAPRTIMAPVAPPLLLLSSFLGVMGREQPAAAAAAADPRATELFLAEFQEALDAMTATDPPPPLVEFGAVYVALSHP